MTPTRTAVLSAALFALSCSTDQRNQTIQIAEPNALGVTSIELEHTNDGFELRGIDASKSEVASVTLRIGTIPDLRSLLPAVPDDDGIGSEIVLAWGSDHERWVSRETQRLLLAPARDPGMQAFLELPAVDTALDREAQIVVAHPSAVSGETAYNITMSCSASVLLSSPPAVECCEATESPYGVGTIFKRGSDNSIITRAQNSSYSNAKCKAQDGHSSCDGSACFYGPFGFSKPSVGSGTAATHTYSYTGNSGPPLYIQTSMCLWDTSHPATFPTVTGTERKGGGCCPNGAGPCDVPSAPACTACGGGNDGAGLWDY